MGHGGGWKAEGSCPATVLLRASLGKPGAELSGLLAPPGFSTGIMHTLHVLAQYGAKSKTSTLGQQCPAVSLQEGNGGGEDGWRLGQESTSRTHVPHPEGCQAPELRGSGGASPGPGLAAHCCPDVPRARGPKGLSVHTTVLKRLHQC